MKVDDFDFATGKFKDEDGEELPRFTMPKMVLKTFVLDKSYPLYKKDRGEIAAHFKDGKAESFVQVKGTGSEQYIEIEIERIFTNGEIKAVGKRASRDKSRLWAWFQDRAVRQLDVVGALSPKPRIYVLCRGNTAGDFFPVGTNTGNEKEAFDTRNEGGTRRVRQYRTSAVKWLVTEDLKKLATANNFHDVRSIIHANLLLPQPSLTSDPCGRCIWTPFTRIQSRRYKGPARKASWRTMHLD